MSRASGLRVSSSLASGSTGIQIVTAPSVLGRGRRFKITLPENLLMPQRAIS